MTDLAEHEVEHQEDRMDIKPKRALARDDEVDLFSTTFGSKESIEIMEHDGADVHNNVSASTSNTKNRATKDDFVESEHTKGCTNIRRLSTPPDTTNGASPHPSGPSGPDPAKDIASDLLRFKRFHDRAVELIPRLPLAEHRYWIGVLNVGVKANNLKQEKDFTWMKGNRLTTVETVWYMYQQTTAIDNFVLLFGYEKVDFKDRVEELDYFNNKKIIFRAVEEDHADAKGRELCSAVIPKEVVPKTISKEVIVID